MDISPTVPMDQFALDILSPTAALLCVAKTFAQKPPVDAHTHTHTHTHTKPPTHILTTHMSTSRHTPHYVMLMYCISLEEEVVLV